MNGLETNRYLMEILFYFLLLIWLRKLFLLGVVIVKQDCGVCFFLICSLLEFPCVQLSVWLSFLLHCSLLSLRLFS